MGRLIFFAVCAFAARGELYVAGFVGGTRTGSADVELKTSSPAAQLTFRSVPFHGRSFDSPVYYGYRFGYFFTDHLGIEGEFIHLKIYADLDAPVDVSGSLGTAMIENKVPMRQYSDQFEVSHGLNMALVNVVVRRALAGTRKQGKARLTLIARVGAGPTVPRPEVILFGTAAGGYETGPVAVQAAGGIQTRLWRGFHVLTEYKYTFTPTSFSIPNGSAGIRVHSHHLVTGLAVHF